MNARRANIILALATIPLALATGFWLRAAQRPESPLDRVNRICGDCGLDVESVAWLIDTMRSAALTREEQLNLFRAQFEEPSDAEICEPCATAILDAAHDPAGKQPS